MTPLVVARFGLAQKAIRPDSIPSRQKIRFPQPRIVAMPPVDRCRILFLAANPESASRLALDEESREIDQKIRSSDYRASVELITKWAIRPEDLLDYLNRYRPHVVHFSGHGTADGQLVLLDKNRQTKNVSKEAVHQVFAALRDNIRVIVLNACYSASQASTLTQTIDCVVGMKSSIGDQAAIIFAAAFYRAIGYGRSIQEAFEQGKAALAIEGTAENDTPVLHAREGVDPSKLHLVATPNDDHSSVATELTNPKWRPTVLYPLQPANFFIGRDELVRDLIEWSNNASPQTRVVALVAAGGSGKTATAEKVFQSLPTMLDFGVFVWSFYENPQTEEFLLEAYKYFADRSGSDAGRIARPLQEVLSGTIPHLLILDGLEQVQSSGNESRVRGQLEDPLLKRLLCWIATGVGTKAKALITSRYSFPDLHAWAGRTFREEHLSDLSAAAAVTILRQWGVKGADAELLGVLRPIQDDNSGNVHALSVSVLGSYLGKICQGDPSKAPLFDASIFAAAEPKAAKISRILATYAERLTAAERDLLARLALFSRGTTTSIIQVIIDAGGSVAGNLAGLSEIEVQQLLYQLCDLGLVFRYETVEGPAFTTHPFLRDFFGSLYGIADPTKVHDAVIARLVPTLTERWRRAPLSSTHDFDQCEHLIEILRLAGHSQRAIDLFFYRLGGYSLGTNFGEDARGIRIISSFAPDKTPATIDQRMPIARQVSLLVCWGLFAQHIGDLTTARQAYQVAIKRQATRSDKFPFVPLSINAAILRVLFGPEADVTLASLWINLAEVETLSGRWPAAESAARSALRHAPDFGVMSRNGYYIRASYAYIAATHFRLGKVADAKELYARALFKHFGWVEWSFKDFQFAEFFLMLGERDMAQSYVSHNLINRQKEDKKWQAYCGLLLGRCAVPNDLAAARQHLEAARTYTRHREDVDATLRCHSLSAEIERFGGNAALAVTEAETGVQLADTCGFTRWSIECRLELAKSLIILTNFSEAVRCSATAFELSSNSDTRDIWSQAEAAELLRDGYLGIGDHTQSAKYEKIASANRAILKQENAVKSDGDLWQGLKAAGWWNRRKV
jgi:tetratricopeptide (TPR) repeat protein